VSDAIGDSSWDETPAAHRRRVRRQERRRTAKDVREFRAEQRGGNGAARLLLATIALVIGLFLLADANGCSAHVQVHITPVTTTP
jgi:hypothetical protein